MFETDIRELHIVSVTKTTPQRYNLPLTHRRNSHTNNDIIILNSPQPKQSTPQRRDDALPVAPLRLNNDPPNVSLVFPRLLSLPRPFSHGFLCHSEARQTLTGFAGSQSLPSLMFETDNSRPSHNLVIVNKHKPMQC